uniref:Uncharacterized protein LOC111130049 n=1 Tax=Crassostrea virginica TaxID=6565 RepID=A0A8B8DVZ5_CRAVI|nr:uncharacterized protein LOC111130049 [Crassostrea virginica]
MAMVTHNGQTIGISDYVSLIIEAARKIIEREQREKGNMDKSGISLVSADASEDTTVNNESEAPKEMGEITPNSQDTNSLLLRLPDGTLQSVEDYIVGIIKDASNQIEKERKNTSITADDILDKSADVENVQTPSKTQPNNTTHEKDSTPSKAAKVNSPRGAGPVSKVLSRIFKRGKPKDKGKSNDELIHGFEESQTTDRAAEDDKSPEINAVSGEEIIAHAASENNTSPGKDGRQEIPKGKGKLKKKNSLRKMLSCFSSKAAQAD